jgi:hypothetical protein
MPGLGAPNHTDNVETTITATGTETGKLLPYAHLVFLPADAPAMLRFGRDDPERVISYSYLILEPSYLGELALSNGIGDPLDFIPTFATPDPFLHEIANALKAAPRINDRARAREVSLSHCHADGTK